MRAFSLALAIAVTLFTSRVATAAIVYTMDDLPGPTYSTPGNGTVSLSPDASLFADAVIGPGESGGGSATLTYDFEVSGPPDVYATVDITGEALVAYYDVADGTYFNVDAGIALGGGGVMSAFCSAHHLL